MRRSREQWSELFQQQEESSLSVVEFCRINKLSPSSYYHWRTQLKSSSDNFISTSTFIQAQVETRQIEPVDCIELRLASSQSLFLPTTTSPTWLADLIQRLA